MLSVIGVYRFHGFLRRFQLRQLCFQFGDSLRIVRADTAHTRAADFIKNTLHILPFLHIAVTGCVLLVFLRHREIAAASHKDRWHTGFNGIMVIQICCQLAGIGVQQRIYFFMVHGINALFLPLGKQCCLIHHLPIFSGGTACRIVSVAVCIIGAPGCALIDRIILDSRGFRLLRRVDGLLPRLVAVDCVFGGRHARCCGFLCDFFPHMVFVGFHFCGFLCKVGELGRVGHMVIACIQFFPAGVHMGKYGGKIRSLLRRQIFAVFQHIRCGAFLLREIAMQTHIRHKLGENHFPFCFVLLPAFSTLIVQHIVLPAFIIGVVFVIGLNMVDQRAVPIPKILPSLVAVALTVKGTINAEFGLVIPATCISGLLALGALFLVQRFEQRISAGKGQLFALLQLVAFTPNDRHHRLHSRIKGRRQFLFRIRSGVALCKRLFSTLPDGITDMQ